MQHVSKDGRSAVAQGAVDYSASTLVSRSVRYVLAANLEPSGLRLDFSKLEQAQINTGVANNTGYMKIGAWAGANPDLALAALESQAEDIKNCVSSR
ncbi:hypothetical protein D3C80_1955980 [compost metagenome]